MIRGSFYSTVLMCALAVTLVETVSAQSEEAGLNLPPQSEVSASSASTEAPRIPVLPPGIAAEVEKIEQEIDSVLRHGQRKSDQDTTRLFEAAKLVVRVRTQFQGEKWWESIDAHYRLSDLEAWKKFDEGQKAEFEKAFELNAEALQLAVGGKIAEGITAKEQCVEIQQQLFGVQHPVTAMSLAHVAGLYEKQGDYGKAQLLQERALAIMEKVLGLLHPDTARILDYLASAVSAQGDYKKALEVSARALAVREVTLGPEHPDTATSLDNTAGIVIQMGAYSLAQPMLERALAIKEKVLGPEDPSTVKSLGYLAVTRYNQGAYTESQALFERGLPIIKRAFGLEDPTTAGWLSVLGGVKYQLGAAAEAQSLFEESLAIDEKALGPDHPGTALAINELAVMFQNRKAYSKAQQLHERALAIQEKTLGLMHPHTASTVAALGGALAQQGDYAKALTLYKRALAIREKVLGSVHPGTAQSLEHLASLHRAQGSYTEAEPLFRRALAINEGRLGSTHPKTANTMSHLGLVLLDLSREQEAASILLRTVQSKWHHMTQEFPKLSVPQKQTFLKSRHHLEAHAFWRLMSTDSSESRTMGLQATLLSKQLIAESVRQEHGAIWHILAEASTAWRTLWQERDGLRRQYAALALQGGIEDVGKGQALFPQGPIARQDIRQLGERIEVLEQQLRSENLSYAEAARLQEITVDQVAQGLRLGQAHVEYVQFHGWDGQTNHYGVYVLRGDQTPVAAIDLGEVTPIDAAVAQIQQSMRRLIEQSKQMTPSRKQLRQSEAELVEAAATLRTLVWTPLESQLKGVKRVYLAPEGQLSLVPFEILPQKTKQGDWRYLVEDQELIYLNTGRDLARLAMTTKPASGSAPESSEKPSAVLVGNPAFGATPREVAQVVAGLPTPAMLVAQAESNPQGSTLGADPSAEGIRRQIPRDWEQFAQLDDLLTKAQKQLTGAGWAVTTLKNTAAVEEAVLQVQAPRMLQLATHGYLLDHIDTSTGGWDNPLLRSMLLLTGVNHSDPQQRVFYRVGADVLSESEARTRELSAEDLQKSHIEIGDGVLTAYEVTGMNLQGTELVNLTACETGLGQVTPDGVIGLRQAFLLAGARALTTSLWEVPADETTEQIAEFYQRWLGTGKNKTSQKSKKATTRYAAFRQTQLAALAKARAEWNGAGHPFFWAGTIYLGDPGDLPTPTLSLKQ